MEYSGVPFFDGFVGSVTPFFIPESVEADIRQIDKTSYPPSAWTRLWKIHGSVNWYIQKNIGNNQERITRLSGSKTTSGGELVIFPSREKFTQSRKLPFLTFQDRLRTFLSSSEALVIVVGYSFSDAHINDIILQGLRSNPRLAVTAFQYLPLSEEIINFGLENRKFTIYGPDKACIGGIVEKWSKPHREKKGDEHCPFWNEESNIFTLGNFNDFTSFLEKFVGFSQPSFSSQGNNIQTFDTESKNQE